MSSMPSIRMGSGNQGLPGILLRLSETGFLDGSGWLEAGAWRQARRRRDSGARWLKGSKLD